MNVRSCLSRAVRLWASVCALLLQATIAVAQQPTDGIEQYSSMEEKGEALNYVIALVLTVLVMFIAFRKPDRVASHD